MGDFYITKVIAKGSGKTDSIIDLQPGLNIIQGRSNTGKTCIIKCIDFCFGSKSNPFDDSLGYDTIVISLHTGKGDITIKRELNKNQVDVVTDVAGFPSGKYDLNHKSKKDPLPILSDLLLASIGIEGEHYIVKNKIFEKKRLTWRTFLHVLLFHVSDIAKEESIIEPEQATEKTFCGSIQKGEKRMTGELIAASVCGLIVVSETIYCVMDLMKHSKKDNRR